MRTTVDLPVELMHAAKVKAAQRGESLKDLFSRALSHEVGVQDVTRPSGRVSLPLIGHSVGHEIAPSNADLEAALEAEDIERYGP